MFRQSFITAILVSCGTAVHAQTENQQNGNTQNQPTEMPPPVTQTEVLRRSVNEHTEPPAPVTGSTANPPTPAGTLVPSQNPNTNEPINPGASSTSGTQGSTSGVIGNPD